MTKKCYIFLYLMLFFLSSCGNKQIERAILAFQSRPIDMTTCDGAIHYRDGKELKYDSVKKDYRLIAPMRPLLDKHLLLSLAFMLLSLLYATVRILVADQFIIPTWSMAPTLIPGDRVVVNKLLMGARIYTDYDFHDGGQELHSIRLKGLRRLKHNDIVVFNYPLLGGRVAFKINYVYCKRCIALPGDSLRIENGHYRCNNYDGVLGLQSEQDRLETVPDDAYDAAGLALHPFDEHVEWTFKHMGPLYIPRGMQLIDNAGQTKRARV